jgi:D-alanyl-D-alanine carboxypeptidase
METYPGMDGIKTGFINSSGFNLVASAKRNGRRLIGVIFGGPSASRRDSHMREILDDGFAQLEGAPAGYIVAEFEKPPEPRARRRLEQFELDPPQVTFGSANRFKTTRPAPEVVRLGNVYRAPRETRAAMRPEPRPVVSKPRATPALSSSPAASRRAADAVRAAATRSTAKPVSHRVDKAPAKAAPVNSAHQSPTAKKSSSRDKPVPASPRCKPGKCRG